MIKLRNEPKDLKADEFRLMLEKLDLYDGVLNPIGNGFSHNYSKDGKVVIDEASGLIWQQGGSDNHRTPDEAQEYIDNLNNKKFAGYTDWRLPTLEEAVSLLEPIPKNGSLYIDSVFDQEQQGIWTSDYFNFANFRWVVNFVNGICAYSTIGSSRSVRAVRSIQPEDLD